MDWSSFQTARVFIRHSTGFRWGRSESIGEESGEITGSGIRLSLHTTVRQIRPWRCVLRRIELPVRSPLKYAVLNTIEHSSEPQLATRLPSMDEALVEMSSRERMRLGQELHDSVGQLLSGITFLARALENKLSAHGLPEAADAAEIGQFVLQALTQTRDLARGLFPVELEADGLSVALTELAARLEKLFGISCRVEAEEKLVVCDRTVANHLFRLDQEAISNSVKHGRATEVVVGLEQRSDVAELFVR